MQYENKNDTINFLNSITSNIVNNTISIFAKAPKCDSIRMGVINADLNLIYFFSVYYRHIVDV